MSSSTNGHGRPFVDVLRGPAPGTRPAVRGVVGGLCCAGAVLGPDVPRDRLSEAAARVEAKKAAYAAHLAEVRRSRWRLGRVAGWWQLARSGPDTDGWVVLDEQLRAFEDIDVVAERRRVSSWAREVLGVESIWRHRDYAADAQGREAYDLEVMR